MLYVYECDPGMVADIIPLVCGCHVRIHHEGSTAAIHIANLSNILYRPIWESAYYPLDVLAEYKRDLFYPERYSCF